MTAEGWHRMLQITGAALGVPAAAVGTFAAYQSYFSIDVTCQKLRNDIMGIMERNVDPDTRSCSRRMSRHSTSFAAKAIPTRGRFSKRR